MENQKEAGYRDEEVSIVRDILKGDNNLELLESVPFGKLAAYVVKRVSTISNEDEAFKSIISHLLPITCFYACRKYSMNESFNILVHERSFKKLFDATSVSASDFDFEYFNKNEIISQGINYYNNHFAHCNLASKTISLIERYMLDYSEINFYKILDENPQRFSKLVNHIKKKHIKLNLALKKLDRYRKEQKYLFDELMLGSGQNNNDRIRLSEVYVEPSFRVYSGCVNEGHISYNYNSSPFVDVSEQLNNFSIHTLVDRFLTGGRQELISGIVLGEVSTIIVLGEPGQGKTSFCKKLLYDISEMGPSFFNGPTFLIRFKDIFDLYKLSHYPFQVFKNKINLELGVTFDFEKTKNILFILEGLDELAANENIAPKAIADLCTRIIQEAHQEKYKVIITSRDRYISFQHLKSLKNVLVVKLKEFDVNKQLEWYDKYSAIKKPLSLTRDTLIAINKKPEKAHIKQLLELPIILTLICELNTPIDQLKTRIDVYNKLLHTVIARKYDNNDVPVPAHDASNHEIQKNRLLDILREMAFEMYMNDRGPIGQNLLVRICSDQDNSDPLTIEKDIKNVLVNFYFKETNMRSSQEKIHPDNYSIEFIHSTFMEYLCAQYIWMKVREELTNPNKTKVFVDDNSALSFFNSLFGRKRLSAEAVSYFSEIIKSDSSFSRETMLKNIKKDFPKLLERDFYIGVDDWTIDRSKNIFLGMWLILSNIRTSDQVFLPPLEGVLMDKFIYFLRIGSYSKLELNNYDFSSLDFSQTNLNGSNLSNSTFEDTYLKGSSMRGCNLENTNFTGADLRCADLTGCNIKNADFTDADLRGSILYEINLEEVKSIKNCKFGNLIEDTHINFILANGGVFN